MDGLGAHKMKALLWYCVQFESQTCWAVYLPADEIAIASVAIQVASLAIPVLADQFTPKKSIKMVSVSQLHHGRFGRYWIIKGSEMMNTKKICIVGASGKLGQYMVQHALERGHEVVGVCRERSVHKLDRFKEKITIIGIVRMKSHPQKSTVHESQGEGSIP